MTYQDRLRTNTHKQNSTAGWRFAQAIASWQDDPAGSQLGSMRQSSVEVARFPRQVRHSFKTLLLMFVPSLSWQKTVFDKRQLKKTAVFLL